MIINLPSVVKCYDLQSQSTLLFSVKDWCKTKLSRFMDHSVFNNLGEHVYKMKYAWYSDLSERISYVLSIA